MTVGILYIGGYGHNRSTLLDRMLGSIDGWVSVGELGNAWRLGTNDGPSCVRGALNGECEFWRAVVGRAFGRASKAVGLDNVRALEPGQQRIGPRRIHDEWRRRLPALSCALVTTISWPLLVRYGYSLQPR